MCERAEVITDPQLGIAYQRIPTSFHLYLVEGVNNLAQPVSYVVQATGLQHAVEAAMEEAYEYVEGVTNRHLMHITFCGDIGEVSHDATPDSTRVIFNARSWALKHAAGISAEFEYAKIKKAREEKGTDRRS